MKTLHDPDMRASLESRVRALQPAAQRRWGRMTVDQMLWHVNESFRMALGEQTYERMPSVPPLPKSLLRFFVIKLPWPKGRSPTYKEWVADGSTHDFAAEKAKLLDYIARTATKSLNGPWVENPTLGQMSGTQWSELQAKHVDHHLRQFGA
ncbi:MAG TPA: DUF1569 domain-containing protein [Gemmatimonadaceae bacterium]|nr:DUF1569 domain-containing protein [Gemmatimonadaceae bacterium]